MIERFLLQMPRRYLRLGVGDFQTLQIQGGLPPARGRETVQVLFQKLYKLHEKQALDDGAEDVGCVGKHLTDAREE